MTSVYLPYAITEMFCIVFDVAILFRLDDNIGSRHEILELKLIVYAFLGMLVADIIWVLHTCGLIALGPLLSATVIAATFICVSLGCYFWFRYVEDRLRWNVTANRYLDIVITIPVIVTCSLDAISIFTGWVFYIDGNGVCCFPDIPTIFRAIINYLYLLVPTIGAVVMAGKTKSKSLRHEYLQYVAYMIVPLMAGLFEDSIPTVPILALSIFMIILIFFLGLISRQVLSDALTGLNNRRWLGRYLQERLATASQEKPVALFMMDINDFKSINDRFGHIEGDSAIRSFATALQMMAIRYDATVARYGGDEFCLVADLDNRSPEEIESGIEIILQAAQSVMSAEEKPYMLSISIGYAVCDHPETRIEAFIGRADDALDEDKARFRRKRNGA